MLLSTFIIPFSGLQLIIIVLFVVAFGFAQNLLIEHFQAEDGLIDYASWIVFKLFVETLICRNILPAIFLCQRKGFRHFMILAVDDFFYEFFGLTLIDRQNLSIHSETVRGA